MLCHAALGTACAVSRLAPAKGGSADNFYHHNHHHHYNDNDHNNSNNKKNNTNQNNKDENNNNDSSSSNNNINECGLGGLIGAVIVTASAAAAAVADAAATPHPEYPQSTSTDPPDHLGRERHRCAPTEVATTATTTNTTTPSPTSTLMSSRSGCGRHSSISISSNNNNNKICDISGSNNNSINKCSGSFSNGCSTSCSSTWMRRRGSASGGCTGSSESIGDADVCSGGRRRLHQHHPHHHGFEVTNSAHLLCGILLLAAKLITTTHAVSVDFKVDCSDQQIRIRVDLTGHNFTDVYLENLKGYPGCAPNFSSDHQAAFFDIPIRDDFRCGVGKMTNKLTGMKTYFHRIVLEGDADYDDSDNNSNSSSNNNNSEHMAAVLHETGDRQSPRDGEAVLDAGQAISRLRHASPDSQSGSTAATSLGRSSERKSRTTTIAFKCQQADRRHLLLNRTKGAATSQFPFELVEPDHLNITEYIEAHAPVPYLEIGIRQNGRLLDTTYNVQPGTPLEMVIYLDRKSKSTYGILNAFLRVSDSAGKQEEVIIMNGCSIDPYIFSNFETPDGGDTLSASFRAFKFPESNYVMFSGTVSICINKCKGIPCGSGQLGYGRRKREIPAALPKDPNALYSVELSTMLKVRFDNDFFKLNKASLTGEFTRASAPVSSRFIEGKTRDTSEQQMYTSSASRTGRGVTSPPVGLLLPLLLLLLNIVYPALTALGFVFCQ